MAIPVIPRGEVSPEGTNQFFKFICPPATGGRNPDPLPPTFAFKRNLLVGMDLVLRDGGRVPMWIIEDPEAPDASFPLRKDALRRSFPSPTLRIPQNALVNGDVKCQGDTHTIHWHGIEPTPMNDGVGHLSFEVDGHFNYQFQPRQAGTFFYHCHKNTVLHFELGLYGLLLIDPPSPAAPDVPVTYPTGGPGYAARLNPAAVAPTDHVVHYDVEAFWIPDDIDSRWHSLGHNAYMQDCVRDDPMNPASFSQDGILNDIRPDIFVLTGIARRVNDSTPFAAADDSLFGPLVAPTLRVEQTLLARAANAAYGITQYTVGIDVEVIAMDGHALGVPPFQQYSEPFRIPANTPFRLTTARRWDFLMRPTVAGTIPVKIEFFNNTNGRLLYTARTAITVRR